RPAAARLERTEQLTAAGDVEAGAVFLHEPANAQVAVRLDAEADERAGRRERRLQLVQMAQQRLLAVDVQRRAVLLGQRRGGDVFTIEGTIAVREKIHERLFHLGNDALRVPRVDPLVARV